MKKIAIPILLLSCLWFGSTPLKLDAQVRTISGENEPVIDHEVQDDPYVPNAYGNQRTSHAYNYGI